MNLILFEKDEIEKPLSLKDERGSHIIKVLKKKEGECFDGGVVNGTAGSCRINRIENGNIYYSFLPGQESKPVFPLLPVTLIIGFPRPIQLKRLLRDCVSLGAASINLTATALGEKSYLNSNLLKDDAIRKNLLEGAMQGRGTGIPSLEFFSSLKQCLDSVSGLFPEGGKILLDISPWAEPLSSLDLKRLSPVCLAIGSERGWTEEERKLFKEKGFVSCSLGKRILRTETAVTAALSLALGRMGLI